MLATVNAMLSNQILEVKLSHKLETLSFSINVFGRVSFASIEYGVFDYLNGYWDQLTEQQQDNIFRIYKEINYGFENINTNSELSEYLSDKIRDLLELHDMEDVQTWIAIKSNIIIPSAFKPDYTHSIDNNTSREKTYTRGDYMKLVTLSVILRCLIPIWGEYINNTRRELGNEFKEYYAFHLLNKSHLINSIPLEKLKLYIEHNVGEDKHNSSNTLGNITSEDYSYWLLALVCIRRLCIGDIRGLDHLSNLITFIYKFIIQRINNTDSNTEDIVKDKLMTEGSSTDEARTSVLELYKIRMSISHEDIVSLEHSISNTSKVAFMLSHTMDANLLQNSIMTSKVLLTEDTYDTQIMLLRWVFKPVISPRGIPYLNKQRITEMLGILQAVLWTRGHKYLALLSTAYSSRSNNDILISPVDSKSKIDSDLAEELDKLYPTANPSTKKNNNKSSNFAIQSIDSFVDKAVTGSWKSTAASELMMEVFGSDIRKVPILPDIKNHLARLIIEVGKRDWA